MEFGEVALIAATLVWVLKTEEMLLRSEWLVLAVLRCEDELWDKLEKALSSLMMLLTSGVSLVLVLVLALSLVIVSPPPASLGMLAVSIPPASLSVLVSDTCDSVIVTVVV